MRPARIPPIVAFWLCGQLLAGCTVGPNYERPQMSVPAAYAGARDPPAGVSTESLGDLSWWEVFRDPALQALLRRACADNLDVKLAAARLELAQAQFQGELANYAPQVQAQANETGQRISPIGLPKNRTSGNPAGSANILGAQATWEIDFWGKYRRAGEAGRALLLSSRAAQQAVTTSLVSAVAVAYLDLLDLDEQGSSARQSLALRRRAVDLTRVRLHQGVSSLSDLRAAEIQVETVDQLIARLQRTTADREGEIRVLLGETSGAIPRGPSLWDETIPSVAPGLPSSLLERRPDIRQAEQELIAATASIGVAKSAYFPNIGLTAEGGLESTDLAKLFTGDAATWLLQPALNLPVFTGGRIRAAVRRAKAQRDISLYQYKTTVQGAFKDVAQALAFRAEADQVESRQTAVARAAENAAQLSEARMEGGIGNLLDVMGTDQTALSARLDLADSRYERLNASARLYSALGGGWRTPGATSAPERR